MQTFSRWQVAGLGLVLLVGSAARCGNGGTTEGTSTGGTSTEGTSTGGSPGPATADIGPAGGTVASADGVLEVTIPAGALATRVALTVTPTAAPVAGAVGTVYEVGPTGTTFTSPVTMTFHTAGFDLGGHPASELQVATVVAGAWQVLAGAAHDAAAETLSGTTLHLSPYGLVVEAGQVCLPVSASGTACLPGTMCPPAPTCASAPPCASYPGAALQSCTDSAQGYAGVCCFAAGAPVCVVTSPGGCGIGSGCSGTPCAQATCAPGGTVQACTATATATSLTCCYPPGTDPNHPPDGGAP